MKESEKKLQVNSRAKHNEKTLPLAIGSLLEMNNYEVDHDIHVHGAQIDIVARSKTDPFSSPIYIEATVEYVSNDKYGKDATKFLLIKAKSPSATCICVSSGGFTASVKERANESGILTLTYEELFSKFEKFFPYVKSILEDEDTKKLVDSYEEPEFSDAKGKDYATKWLGYWRGFSPDPAKWLIVLGEYGTGKTSLTRVIQQRWIADYQQNPTNPIPVRVELRNFTRQFDARGLIHHFLDTSLLNHVSIEFMMHLIRSGRVILILDGYDEMAQFLNARERRACLSALAEFSAGGARGILTSRPNYFTEAEELNVFEALYATIEQSKFHLSRVDRTFIAEEKVIDNLVEKYVLNRYERSLQDLTPAQTESLVMRSLKNDAKGQGIVLSILKKVFRDEADGSRQALSGKPVIITYLLELIEDLRSDDGKIDASSLTEWQIYKLIVDRLMFRDLRRSPTLSPAQRRKSLQKLAVALSGRDSVVANESTFQAIIEEEFRTELRVMQPEDRRVRKEELFEDLRSSTTLTRAHGTRSDGWVFSHNSLREYLAAEYFLESLGKRSPVQINIPITPAMRSFASSISDGETEMLLAVLSELWPARSTMSNLGPYLVLLWDAARKRPEGLRLTLASITGDRAEDGLQIAHTSIKGIDVGQDFHDQSLKVNAESAEVSDTSFEAVNLIGSRFDGAVLDTISFRGCNLAGTSFIGALLFECDFTGANVSGANFYAIDVDSNILVTPAGGNAEALSGKAALGYLRFNGANTGPVDDYFIYRNHPRFSIVEKICERISEQRNSQLRGLTQRGEARVDPPFARQLVDRLVSAGWVQIDRNDLVSATPAGRNVLAQVVSHQILPEEIVQFLSE